MSNATPPTIVITGASDGIGAAAGRQLATAGATVVFVGRSPEKTRAVAEPFGADYYLADFTRLDEVRQLATALTEKYDRIDVLANNAGGMFSGPTVTADGFEKTFQVNHLAPVLLTRLLIDKLIDSRAAVINTASIAARLYGKVKLDDLNNWREFNPNTAYGNAKLANILFTGGLHERFHAQGISTVAFHPGFIATNFASDTNSRLQYVYRTALKVFLTSAEQGGARLRHFIEGQPNADWLSGRYYGSTKRIRRTHKQACDPDLVREHWRRSADMLGIRW
ncbi:MAG: SDR family NAD(P)-dependent oxidoreductase [Yaniella sp.]|nr:SDR family NAD(P)-dependent oxidoreductase [Yaniella sp.]